MIERQRIKAAISGSFGMYGTYTVDENGHFGSTFPNRNGIDRRRSQITEFVQGDTMTENLTESDGLPIVIVWQRVR